MIYLCCPRIKSCPRFKSLPFLLALPLLLAPSSTLHLQKFAVSHKSPKTVCHQRPQASKPKISYLRSPQSLFEYEQSVYLSPGSWRDGHRTGPPLHRRIRGPKRVVLRVPRCISPQSRIATYTLGWVCDHYGCTNPRVTFVG